jgi:hypothetical protein
VNATQDELQRAIDYLGATCVRPGIIETVIGGDGKGPNRTSHVRGTLYAYRDRNAERFYTIDRDTLFDLQRRLNQTASASEREDAYQDWCDATEATGMPFWWSPEQRFAIKYAMETKGQLYAVFATAEEATNYRDLNHTSLDRVITADLETGEEIPA